MNNGTQRITFGPEADEFNDVLRLLCERSLAVTILLRDGQSFGAVLGSAESGTLIYEAWDEARGVPSGEVGTVEIGEVVEVRVF